MNMRSLMSYGAVALAIGVLVGSWYAGIISFHWPLRQAHSGQDAGSGSQQEIPLWFWREGKWRSEKVNLVLSSDVCSSVSRTTQAWAQALYEEGLTNKRIGVEAVLCGADSQTIYISFDRYPFEKEASLFDKWMRIEALLKTIRGLRGSYSKIHFLVHHKQLNDYHLDFSNPWPISGYHVAI